MSPEELCRLLDVALSEHLLEPPPEAVAADGLKGARAARPRKGGPESPLDSEAEPDGIRDGPERTRRIVHERERVEEPEALPLEIPLSVERIEKGSEGSVGREPTCHRVDREVPAAKILGDPRSGRDDRKGAGPWIALRPGRRHVDTKAARGDERRRPESRVRGDERPARQSRERRRKVKRPDCRPFDRDIQVVRRATKDEIADGASDDEDGKARIRRDASQGRENPDERSLPRRNSLLLPESYGVAYW